MAHLEWNEDYSVGEDDMDRQHQILFDYVNEFFDASIHMPTSTKLIPILDKITDYTKYHFDEEEEHMEKNNYPGLELHKSIHASLIKSLNEFIDKVKEEPETTMEVRHFLKQWLIDHIKCVDRDYANFITDSQK